MSIIGLTKLELFVSPSLAQLYLASLKSGRQDACPTVFLDRFLDSNSAFLPQFIQLIYLYSKRDCFTRLLIRLKH